MKITFTPTENRSYDEFPHGEVTISYPSDDLTLDDMLEDLIIPALYGLGYKGVDKYFDLEADEFDEEKEKDEYKDEVEKNDLWGQIKKEADIHNEKERGEVERNQRIKISAQDYTMKMDNLMKNKNFKKLFIPEQLQMLLEEASKYDIIIDLKTNK